MTDDETWVSVRRVSDSAGHRFPPLDSVPLRNGPPWVSPSTQWGPSAQDRERPPRPSGHSKETIARGPSRHPNPAPDSSTWMGAHGPGPGPARDGVRPPRHRRHGRPPLRFPLPVPDGLRRGPPSVTPFGPHFGPIYCNLSFHVFPPPPIL